MINLKEIEQHKFHDGQKLNAIHFPDGDDISATSETTITVIMEMDGVPWAIVDGHGSIQKWNLALVMGVELEQA